MGIRVFALPLAFILTLPLMAGTVYTYTGNDFTSVSVPGEGYTTSDSVTGSFTVALPLGPGIGLGTFFTPVAYNFTDGVQDFSSSAPPAQVNFTVETDTLGNIIEWFIDLSSGSPQNNTITTSYNGSGNNYDSGVMDFDQFGGQNLNDQGTWSESSMSATPEPASLMMVGCALIAFGSLRRRSLRRS